MSIAEKIERHFGVDIPTAESTVYADDPRAWASERMHELASRLASGELDGASFQWCQGENTPYAVQVEGFPATESRGWVARLTRITIKPNSERVQLVKG